MKLRVASKIYHRMQRMDYRIRTLRALNTKLCRYYSSRIRRESVRDGVSSFSLRQSCIVLDSIFEIADFIEEKETAKRHRMSVCATNEYPGFIVIDEVLQWG